MNKMHFNVYDVFYSLNSPQHVLAVIVAIFRVMLLLQKYKGTNVVRCVAFSPCNDKTCFVIVLGWWWSNCIISLEKLQSFLAP